MNELFVFVKLINGDQMMAIKESETEESLTLKFPMQIRLHKVLQNEITVGEQITAGPYSQFVQKQTITIDKRHVVINEQLAHRAIPHFINLVKEHDGIAIKVHSDSIDLEYAYAVEELEDHTEEPDENCFVDGNDTIH
jgi:hypothetical protein